MKCQIKQISRRSRAKKCTKKCYALAKLLFCLLNLLFSCCFPTFSLPSRRRIVKSLVERVRRASAWKVEPLLPRRSRFFSVLSYFCGWKAYSQSRLSEYNTKSHFLFCCVTYFFINMYCSESVIQCLRRSTDRSVQFNIADTKYTK